MLQKNDWRIMSQDSYIHGRSFKKNVYHAYRPGWDHDHCIYCTEKFAEEKLSSGSIQEGYSTIDEGLWVCPQCYEDFKNYYDMFLMDPGLFSEIFNKYDKEDLIEKLKKNLTIIEHL